MTDVHEIAVRAVKPGKAQEFRTRRAGFIAALTKQPGVTVDREFESFLAMPRPDDTEVFVGMTTYASLQANAKIQRNPGVLWKFLRFARTMSLKAYVYVTPTEGPDFNLRTLATGPGQVLEVAVRRVTDREQFDRTRAAFITLLSSQTGVLDSWEFAVVKGKNTDGLTVGMTVYESREALQSIMGSIVNDPVTQSYFGTFEPVAVQYTTSSKA